MDRFVDEILTFWFGELLGPADLDRDKIGLWWNGAPADDAAIRQRFGGLCKQALDDELDEWAETPRGRLALILLLDQFTRALGRGSRAAFAGDLKALELALEGQVLGHDESLGLLERTFMYMPMMHAENRDIAEHSVATFEALSADIKDLAGEDFPDSYEAAVLHASIVMEFGRYPHRNTLMNRASTADERAFLEDGGPTFGQSEKTDKD